MAVADVYDALISRRPYKAALSHEQAVAIIQKAAAAISTLMWYPPSSPYPTPSAP